MRRIIVYTVLLLASAGFQALEACTVVQRSAPVLFTVATPDAEYVLALVEPIERYQRFQPNDDEKKILERFPVSGVYRGGVAPKLVWQLDDWFDPPTVHSFFSSVDGVHLVLGDPGGLRFYRDGELVREVGRLQLFSAPWRAGESSCGGPTNLDVKASSSGRQPEVVVNTDEGGRFVFAARTGALLSERRPPARAAVIPSAEEETLAVLVSDLTALAKASQLSALSYEWMRRFEEVSLHDCSPEYNDLAEIAEVANKEVGPDHHVAIWLSPWRAERPVNADVLGLAQLRLPQETPFAMYRVPEGEAARTLCGIEPLPTRLLAARLSSSSPDRQAEYEPLAEALNGPTVLVATAAGWKGYGKRDLIGLATLWRHVDGEWRVLGFQLFALPPEAD